MIVIAHRGAPTEALENSQQSFSKAIGGGASRIETDLQLTADHRVVICHDSNIMKMTGNNLEIATSSYQALSKCKLVNGESLLTLEQLLLENLADIELNLELKGEDRRLVETTLDLLPPQDQRPRKIIISSFSLDLLTYTAKLAPKETLALLSDQPVTNFSHLKDSMTQCGAEIFHPEVKTLDHGLVTSCLAEGWLVYPYVSLNDETPRPAMWDELAKMGVHGLCTNYPREMTRWKEGR